MRAMTDQELRHLLPDVPVLNKSDLTKLEDGKSYIFNMDSPEGPGTHWVAICNLKPLYVFYFDSFACPPPTHLQLLMSATKKRQVWASKELQALNSNSCGEWCVMFLQQMASGMNPSQFYRQFATPWDNERILEQYFRGRNIFTNNISNAKKADEN